MISRIRKIVTLPITKSKFFSYGQFIRDNPKANRKERQKAIKKYLDSTR